MKYVVDTDVLAKENLTLTEFGVLLYFAGGGVHLAFSKVCKDLWDKGYFIKEVNNEYSFDPFKFEQLETIMSESSIKPTTTTRAETLAPKLRELYPGGYKEVFIGGIKKKYPWKDSDRVISNRLKIFFKRYGDKYTDEQIIDATKRYVEGNKEDPTFMKLLKYFIFKDNRAVDGAGDAYVDESSELVAFMENPELIGGKHNDIGELI